ARRAAAGRGGRRRAGSRIEASASQVLRVEERDEEVDEEGDRDDAADQVQAAHLRAPSASQPAMRPKSRAAETTMRGREAKSMVSFSAKAIRSMILGSASSNRRRKRRKAHQECVKTALRT